MNEMKSITQQNNNDQHISSSISLSRTESYDMHFYKCRMKIIDKITHGRYKKAFIQIVKYVSIFTGVKEACELFLLKIRVINKIIQRKFDKYDLGEDELVNMIIINSLIKWLLHLETELDRMIYIVHSNDNIDNKENKEIIQYIIRFFLEFLYLKTLFHKRINHIGKACSLIGLSIKIINQSMNIITMPVTLNIIQNIYLLAANIHLGNQDYIKSLEYTTKVLELCFRELFFRIDVYIGLDDAIKNSVNKNKYLRIFNNITSAYTLRGICKEHLGRITKAIESYQQSKFFSSKFLTESNPFFSFFIMKLLKRANRYHDVFTKLLGGEAHRRSKRQKAENMKQQQANIANGNYANSNKYAKVQSFVSKLKMEELELPTSPNRPFSPIERCKSDIMLSGLKLIDIYRNEDFEKTLSSMNQINLGYFDHETKGIIQRAINKMYFKGTRNRKRNNNSIIKRQSSSIPVTLKNQSSTTTISHQIGFSFNNTNTFITNNIRKNTSSKLVKYLTDKKCFSLAFKKKKMYLDKLESKDLDFQRKILSLRSNEKYVMKLKEPHDSEEDMVNKFAQMRALSPNNHVSVRNKLTLSEFKDIQSTVGLENTMLKSLDTKTYSLFNHNLIEKQRMKKKINERDTIKLDVYNDHRSVNKKNKDIIQSINDDIITINNINSPKRLSQKKGRHYMRKQCLSLTKIKKSEFDLKRFIQVNK